MTTRSMIKAPRQISYNKLDKLDKFDIDIEVAAEQLLALNKLQLGITRNYPMAVAHRSLIVHKKRECEPSEARGKFPCHKRRFELVVVPSQKKRKSINSHASWQRKLLRDWFLSRASTAQGPYPTEQEKHELALATNLEFKQVESFFSNGRRSDRSLWTKKSRRLHREATARDSCIVHPSNGKRVKWYNH